MKKLSRLLSLFVALCMVLSLGAFASGEPSGASEEPASSGIPATAETKSVSDMTASEYEYLTNYSNRKTPGAIFVGEDLTASGEIALDETVTGEGYTAVYAHGEDADVTVSGTLVVLDDSQGENTSDFSGQGSATVAYDSANLTLKDLTYYSEGFERGVTVVSQNSTVTIEDSDITVMGNDPLTNAWEGYHSSADQNYMISPPWPLGVTGGARILNMIGTTPKLTILNSTLVGGQTWGLLSTDSGSSMTINVVDSELISLPESEGGSDSGWRIFGYDEDAYGSAYGSYYIGGPSQYYYGATFDGVTYAAIITGAEIGYYGSSNGTIELTDASGEPMGTVQGKGQPTVINGVFGFMQHNSISDGIYVVDGTIINSADAIVIQKAAKGNYIFDNAELNSGTGVLFQMIDNDDDSRIGGMPMAVDPGFDETYSDSKLASHGIGFPGVNYDVTTSTGGYDVAVSYANGEYNGNIYNGTGYYGKSGDNLNITLGENAVLNGDIALTSTIKGVPYSAEAIKGIEYYGDDIQYVLLDAEGNETKDAAKAAFIQITDYTINEYFLQGHVQNLLHFNGASTISVTVGDGAEWTIADESLITSLVIEDGAVVKGALVENADGSVTITAGSSVIPAGTYGGKVAVVGGAEVAGGGVTADGVLDVGAAMDAIEAEQGAAASGEPAGSVTWADYQAYLVEAAGGNAPDLDEFKAQVAAIGSWDEMPLDQSPWDQLFSTLGISTWEQFQAGEAAASQVEGTADASAEPTASSIAALLIATSLSAEPGASNEPSGEPEADETVVVIGGVEYVLDVYVIDGEEYVKLSDLAGLFGGEDDAAPAADGDVTWADYQAYLVEAAGGNAPDLDEFKGQVAAIGSWDEMPLDESPWDMLFTTVGISTWEQFQAGVAAASQVEGAMG